MCNRPNNVTRFINCPSRSMSLWVVWSLLLILTILMVTRSVLYRSSVEQEVSQPSHFDLYVINLDRAKTRMQRFMSRLQSTDLADTALIRLRAIDGNNVSLQEHVTGEALQEIQSAERNGYRQRHYELTRGAVGCYLSHFEAWDRLLASDKNYIMICEDDAVLDDDIRQKTENAITRLPFDWDILLLGYWCVRCDRQQGFRKMQRFFGLHCYVINRQGVEKVKAYAGIRVSQQIDSMLSDMCSEGRLEVYGLEEKAAMQSGTNSSVQMPLKTTKGVDPWEALAAVRAIRSLTTA